MKILEELFARGILSEKQLVDLKKQINETGKTEEEIIIEKKIISEKDLFEIKSKILNIPLKKVNASQISPALFEIIPEETSVNYKVAVLAKEDNILHIGMVYPEDIAARNVLRFLANQQNFNYKIYLITLSDLVNILKQRHDIEIETKKTLEKSDKELGVKTGESADNILYDLAAEGSLSKTSVVAEDAPIVKIVFIILKDAVEKNASDIHIEPQKDKLNIRFRLNGILRSRLSLPLKIHPSIVARIKILAGLKIDENRIPQDGRFSSKINNKEIDFRVATFPTLYGEKVELRVLDPFTGLKSFEELGLTGRNLELVKAAIKKPYGMILSAGPTGSGKTTTQYAILRSLNKDNVNIVTLEDPVEYSIPGVNQSQVKPEIGYSFARGLRQILRQDPNIIMVGEIRDEETADLAVNAALTGHIVLSTIHANSSVGVIPRLIDMGVKSFLIPSTISIAISQRLIRLLCPYCKIKITPPSEVRKYILEKIKSINKIIKEKEKITIGDNFYIYASRGCEFCDQTGYSGRVAIYEVLLMTEELGELIQKNPSENLIFKLAQRQGMLTLEQEGILKVLEGKTSIQELVRATGKTE